VAESRRTAGSLREIRRFVGMDRILDELFERAFLTVVTERKAQEGKLVGFTLYEQDKDNAVAALLKDFSSKRESEQWR
jgi:hypothetical protein